MVEIILFCLGAIVGFVFGLLVAINVVHRDAVSKMTMDWRGVVYRLVPVNQHRATEKSFLAEVKQSMDRGEFDASIARVQMRNDRRSGQ